MVGMGSALGKWGGERESGVEKNGRKNASSSPVLCVSRGRRRLMVPFKSAPFAYSLFFFKLRRFTQNAPFEMVPKCVNSDSILQFVFFFHFGPWFWISSIDSLIAHQTSIFM
jgi:hypothetical protein